MFLTVPAVLIIAWIESMIQAGQTPTIAWQLFAYVFLTAAEVMIYQTGMEFSYTQSPNNMKSMIMSFYLLTMSALGNQVTELSNNSSKMQTERPNWKASLIIYFSQALIFTAAIPLRFTPVFTKKKPTCNKKRIPHKHLRYPIAQ
jgi:POT family proton-dependent oligopeptide transporter